MGEMLAEINRIVAEDISVRVTQYDVLFEGITNSIQANATQIICQFGINQASLGDEGLLKVQKVDSISIEDNGDGITTDNYASFCKYRTKHKKTLGCKGVGRFVFLKVYSRAKFKSSVKSEQVNKEFIFSTDFDTESIITAPAEVSVNRTITQFERLTEEYFDSDRKVDKRIELDLHQIRLRVLTHLMPTLYFYKKKGQNVRITFVGLDDTDTVEISENDIPEFLDIPFSISDKYGAKQDFILHHHIDNNKGELHSFYCANNRAVHEFSEHDFKVNLPKGYSGFFLLESTYLDGHVNNERNVFDIYPVKTDVVSPISWDMINSHMKTEIGNLISQIVPEAKQINAEKLKEIQDERPYLVQYIDEGELDMLGFLEKKSIIDKAKKKFDTAKENVLANSGKEEFTNQELQDAIQLAQSELVSYVHDRAQVLERLTALSDKGEKVEAIIHNLFMEKGTTDDYFVVGKNNLWLLDDRFTSYSYAASDKKIKEVIESIGESADDVDNPNDEPDISLFFSHDPNNPERLQSVVVEIKSFDYDSKPNRKKFAGIQQLREYVEAFQKKASVQDIYGFLITEIDEKFAKDLINDNYAPLYSTESPIYHRFYDKMGISIYVVSAKTLIRDAKARNKVFLDIIKKQSKLNKIIESIPVAPVENIDEEQS